jgi:leucine-rich repeat protein SHOC2
MQTKRNHLKLELPQWLTAMGVSWGDDLANLHTLKLRSHQLTSLPESIGQLANLQTLEVHSNQITSLPKSIGQLTNLHELWLNNNGLTSLPESIGQLANLHTLMLSDNQLTSLPESIGQLANLRNLCLNSNQLTRLPESIGRLTVLHNLELNNNKLTNLPISIGQLNTLSYLELADNQLTSLPESIGQLIELGELHLNGNPLTDLSPLQPCPCVYFLGVNLPRCYRTKLSDWQPEWLLDEDNAEMRRVLIQQLGYERIGDVLGASAIDTWREYTLLKIDNFQAVYEDEDEDEPSDWEPMLLLKMTCPSTAHIHMLRVPPDLTSAEAAITWVNHGIHPDRFAIQT